MKFYEIKFKISISSTQILKLQQAQILLWRPPARPELACYYRVWLEAQKIGPVQALSRSSAMFSSISIVAVEKSKDGDDR